MTELDDEAGDPGVAAGMYHWENAYQRSWDALEEDAGGSLAAAVQSAVRQQQQRRRLLLNQTQTSVPVQRGLIRHVFVVLDMSEAMGAPADYLLPTRLECILAEAERFVFSFLTVNPLGCLGLISTHDAGAEKLTELTANGASQHHATALQYRPNREPRGEPSLQNALEVARRSLLHVPAHGSREIIVLYNALTTCDPGNIYETIAALKKDNIRVSIVGMGAEMRICKHICKETKGVYNVIMNESHLREVMQSHVAPPPVEQDDAVGLAMIEMGFPSSSISAAPVLCGK
ncbi:hypothetical protein HDU98_003778 [Podochytrium sp. JEL0797]|nr:hypothetical protein HDU98_003778 [Podochytrium sp. JEL0797]